MPETCLSDDGELASGVTSTSSIPKYVHATANVTLLAARAFLIRKSADRACNGGHGSVFVSDTFLFARVRTCGRAGQSLRHGVFFALLQVDGF